MRIPAIWSVLFLVVFSNTSSGARRRVSSEATCPKTTSGSYRVLQTLSRNKMGFTQGLIYLNGELLESTGNISGAHRVGKSVLNRIHPTSGNVQEWVQTPGNAFGEGLTFLNGIYYQLTYLEGSIFLYRINREGSPDIEKKKTPLSSKEGWGLTTDGKQLIASDGSDQLFFLAPETLQLQKSISVRDAEGNRYPYMNELEYVEGKVLANLFMTDRIIRIDLKSGCVERTWDLSKLKEQFTAVERRWISSDSNFVLNGIAYDSQKRQFFVTGKMWPKIFKVEFN